MRVKHELTFFVPEVNYIKQKHISIQVSPRCSAGSKHRHTDRSICVVWDGTQDLIHAKPILPLLPYLWLNYSAS
jgi:hypothetical protein